MHEVFPPKLYPHVASSKLTQADHSASRTAVCVGTTKDMALIGPLAETDPFIASGDVDMLAKIAALHVVCVGHGPPRS